MTNWNVWDDGESSENIILPEPKLQNCSNLYGPLHWWKGWVSIYILVVCIEASGGLKISYANCLDRTGAAKRRSMQSSMF